LVLNFFLSWLNNMCVILKECCKNEIQFVEKYSTNNTKNSQNTILGGVM
jgi:hypothetical protein